MEENLFTFVVTRQGFGFLFGTMNFPFAPEGVKSICKTLGVEYSEPTTEFDDMIDDIKLGAIYFPSTSTIKWFDLNDGTVEYVSQID